MYSTGRELMLMRKLPSNYAYIASFLSCSCIWHIFAYSSMKTIFKCQKDTFFLWSPYKMPTAVAFFNRSCKQRIVMKLSKMSETWKARFVVDFWFGFCLWCMVFFLQNTVSNNFYYARYWGDMFHVEFIFCSQGFQYWSWIPDERDEKLSFAWGKLNFHFNKLFLYALFCMIQKMSLGLNCWKKELSSIFDENSMWINTIYH